VRVDGRQLGVFAVANRFEGEREEVDDALRVAIGVSLAVLALSSLLAWVVAGRVLAPLRLLSDTAHSIGESDLTRRIPVTGDDELAELARTFNAMLGRLEAAFESQKAFIADAGHELRTPITIVRGHLETLGDDPEDRRDTVELVTDELERMSRLVDELSLLAKARRPDFVRPEPIALDQLTRRLFAKASALAPRAWRLDAPGGGEIEADPQRLTEAVLNLAQNAVEHTGEGDLIELGARLADNHARLWVRDSGPGIDPAARERIFERFGRGENAAGRREGSGLGLAITRAIAEAHGGGVELDSRPGHGATFTLSIPVRRRAS
jgi:signal transduction histidine kinase